MKRLFPKFSRSAHPKREPNAVALPAPPEYLSDPFYNDPVAFDGAFGYGANATGGRGNGTSGDTTLYFVDNLNDSGTGSFRAAFEATGKRVIVPRVSGYVLLEDDIRPNDNYTFLGQLSPGGMGIRNLSDPPVNHGLLLHYPTNNVICRYLTVRSNTVDPNGTFTSNDAIRVAGCTNVILDHISGSYATDGIMDFSSDTNVTTQDCLWTYPLTGDPEGDHEYITLLAYGCNGVTMARSIFNNARARVPEIHSGSTAQFIGNTIYNCRGKTLSFIDVGDPPNIVDVRRNMYIQGAAGWDDMTSSRLPLSVRNKKVGTTERDVIYMEGNDGPMITDPLDWSEQQNMVYVYSAVDSATDPSRDPLEWITNTPNGMPEVPLLTAAEYNTYVYANAGNVLFRDAVDSGVVDEIQNDTGVAGNFATAADAGGYPAFTSGTYPTAADGVISDAWRSSTGESRNWYELDTGGTKRMVIENYADDIANGDWVEP